MNFLSKNPKLSLEKMLVFGALGLYAYKFIRLQKSGELQGEPNMLVRIDKDKMFATAQKHFKLSDTQVSALAGVYDLMMSKKEDDV